MAHDLDYIIHLDRMSQKNKAEEFVPRTYEGLEELDEDEFPEDSGFIDEPLED